MLGRHQRLLLSTVIDYFSFGILLRTLLAPWKRDELSMAQPTLGQRVQLAALNMVGRLIGALVRLAALGAGVLMLAGVLTLCGMLWLAWLLAPFLGLGLMGLGMGMMLGVGR